MLRDPFAGLLPAYVGTIPATGRHMIWLHPAGGHRMPLGASVPIMLATRWGETSDYSRAAAHLILYHAGGRAAIPLADRFVRDVLAPLDPHDGWRYPVSEIRAWLAVQMIAR